MEVGSSKRRNKCAVRIRKRVEIISPERLQGHHLVEGTGATILIAYGLGDWAIGVRSPAVTVLFHFTIASGPVVDPTEPPFESVSVALSGAGAKAAVSCTV
jgi:hypothetical protein